MFRSSQIRQAHTFKVCDNTIGNDQYRTSRRSAVVLCADDHRRPGNCNHDAYLPDLANSMNNPAYRLAEADRRMEAPEAAQEAANYYCELMTATPAFPCGKSGLTRAPNESPHYSLAEESSADLLAARIDLWSPSASPLAALSKSDDWGSRQTVADCAGRTQDRSELTPRGDVADLLTDDARSVHYGAANPRGKRQALPTVRSNVVRRTVPLFR